MLDRQIITHLRIKKFNLGIQDDKISNYITVNINGAEALADPDSGAQANVIDQYQLDIINKQDALEKLLSIKPAKEKLYGLIEESPIVGYVEVCISNKVNSVHTKIFIVKDKMRSGAIIGPKTLTDLNILKYTQMGKQSIMCRSRTVKKHLLPFKEVQNICPSVQIV